MGLVIFRGNMVYSRGTRFINLSEAMVKSFIIVDKIKIYERDYCKMNA